MKKSITLSLQNHPMDNLQQVHPVKEQSSYVLNKNIYGQPV